MENPSSSENLLQTLNTRGWCFRDINLVNSLIAAQLPSSSTVSSIESELLNTDLRSVGGKSLPDFSLLRKSSHIQGPKVLQISSVRDISRSTMAENSESSNSRRLLRLKLTDGHSEITAIEYSHIPSIPDDVVPGTKVRLENKATIHSGIVCLNAKMITVLGGTVSSLYEEWQMNKKYSGFSRSTLKVAHEDGTAGPPPFEKLQIGALQKPLSQHKRYSGQRHVSPSFGKRACLTYAEKAQSSTASQTHRFQNNESRIESTGNELKPPAHIERIEEKPSTSESRPKEVAEAVPVQNQAAAQKLLQKMSQPPPRGGHHSRGRGHRGRDREEDESHLLTLEEWERRKTGANVSAARNFPDVSQDEDLARQLQHQLDFEDLHPQYVAKLWVCLWLQVTRANYAKDLGGKVKFCFSCMDERT
uniref:RecQ mediated genome instability protein 1 OB-fold domain-containing protein n=1 Tax=Solanum lycopersicum TaxID=4081 RepID=A0A3Q7JRH8_SOLLC